MTRKIFLNIILAVVICFTTTGSTQIEKQVKEKEVIIPPHLRQEKIKVDQVRKTKEGKEIFRLVDIYSKKYNVDKKLVLALVMTESNFDSKAISKSGAKGLGQLMPSTFKAREVGNDIFNVEQNIHATTKHYAGLVGRYNGNNYYALAAYNLGGNKVKIGKPIPKSTQMYISKVQERKVLFENI